MSGVEDGGPAFQRDNQNGYQQEGMPMRDWFAGQALAGLCANRGYINAVSWETAPNSVLVSRAYALADAMLAARKGGE